MNKSSSPTAVGSAFVQENFEPSDHLAIVLINRRTGEVRQRLAEASRIADLEFQVLLQEKNAEGFEVYISMNALKPAAIGRTKQDIAEIRHVFLDFDHQGSEALERLSARQDLPAPHFVVSTSPGKYQVIWRVEGFSMEQAERLQQGLARQTGAQTSPPPTRRASCVCQASRIISTRCRTLSLSSGSRPRWPGPRTFPRSTQIETTSASRPRDARSTPAHLPNPSAIGPSPNAP